MYLAPFRSGLIRGRIPPRFGTAVLFSCRVLWRPVASAFRFPFHVVPDVPLVAFHLGVNLAKPY